MRRIWQTPLVLFIIVTVFVSIFTVGCQPKPEDGIVLNDILQLQQMEISSFDPLDAYHAGHIQMVKQLYNTLVDIDFEGKPIPSLAAKWETGDGKIWRFYLVENAYFIEDPCFESKAQRLFNASDVKYTFERLLRKDSKSLGVSYFTNILGAEEYRKGERNDIEGIKVVDDHTIDFVLKEIDFSFDALLTLPYSSIVQKRAVEYYGDDFSQHPVGTGPFVLQKYEPNKEIILSKNGDYWEKQAGHQLPYVDEVIIHLTSDDNLALLMFKSQESDFLELSLPLLKQLKTMDIPFNYKTETEENPQLNFYLINLETLKDTNTRRAINYAINRSELQKILSDEGNVTQSLYPPAIFKELASPQKILSMNPDKAKEFLNINSLKVVCFDDVLSRSIASFIAQSLKTYGVSVEIESAPFPVLVDRLTTGKYDLIQIYWGPLYADVFHYLNPFLTSSFPPAGNNFNRYSNPEFDRLVAEAKSLPPDRRPENLLKAEDVILNDMPFLLLYFKNTIRASNEKFDMPLHPLQYRFYKYAKQK
ncbi:MAG: ABC transporter substrate-binding protein [Dehalococcoidia bacterium]|nr:ABC transporter substrate-binding protein [Dehalococcoidia bacterium]